MLIYCYYLALSIFPCMTCSVPLSNWETSTSDYLNAASRGEMQCSKLHVLFGSNPRTHLSSQTVYLQASYSGCCFNLYDICTPDKQSCQRNVQHVEAVCYMRMHFCIGKGATKCVFNTINACCLIGNGKGCMQSKKKKKKKKNHNSVSKCSQSPPFT